MGKVFNMDGEDLEEKSGFISVKMNLSEDTVKMVKDWCPVLEDKGLAKGETQTFTYLARLGSAFLEQYKQGNNIYVGKDKKHTKEANIINFLHKV
jgi:hypothetical protein